MIIQAILEVKDSTNFTETLRAWLRVTSFNKKRNRLNHVRVAKNAHYMLLFVWSYIKKDVKYSLGTTQMHIISCFPSTSSLILRGYVHAYIWKYWLCVKTTCFLWILHVRRGNLNPVQQRQTPPRMMKSIIQESRLVQLQCKVKDVVEFQIHGPHLSIEQAQLPLTLCNSYSYLITIQWVATA